MTICLYQQLSGQRVLSHVTKLNQNIDKCKNSGNNSTFLQKSNKTPLLNLSHPFMCYVPVQSKVLDPPSFSLQMLTTWLVSTCGVVVVLFIGSQRLKKKIMTGGSLKSSRTLLICWAVAAPRENLVHNIENGMWWQAEGIGYAEVAFTFFMTGRQLLSRDSRFTGWWCFSQITASSISKSIDISKDTPSLADQNLRIWQFCLNFLD